MESMDGPSDPSPSSPPLPGPASLDCPGPAREPSVTDLEQPRAVACLQGSLPIQRLHKAYRLSLAGSPLRWLEAAAIAAVFMLSVAPVAISCRYISLDQVDFNVVFLVKAFFVPCLLEETVFRVLLNPHVSEEVSLMKRSMHAIFSVTIYMLWHPLNAWLLTPSARTIFYQFTFLAVVEVLGFLCLVMYVRTGSVLAPVLFHWIVVSFWLTLGGRQELMPEALQVFT